jgi:hypothetical protein
MPSFKISKYIGSNTVMICFLSACCKVLYIRQVSTASSQECLAALSCAAVPDLMTDGARPGAYGFTHSTGPFSLLGATMAYAASEHNDAQVSQSSSSQVSVNIPRVGL